MSSMKYAQKNWFWLCLGGVFLLAFGLRFYQLGQVPVSLYWDEVAQLVDAKSIAQTGRDMHNRVWYQLLFPSYGDYKLPVYIWLSSVAVKVLGVSEFALRLPSAIAGMISVGLASFVGWKVGQKLGTTKKNKHYYLTSKLTAIASGFVIAVSPWSVLFSRTGFEGHLAQMWFGISIAILLGFPTKKWSGFLSSVFGALATYTYFSVRFVWPPVFFATILLLVANWWSDDKKLAKNLIQIAQKTAWWILLPIVLYGVLLVPMTRSPIYADSNRFRLSADSVLNAYDYPIVSNQYREWAGNTLIDRAFYHRHFLLFQELLDNYTDHLSLQTLFVNGDPNLRHSTGEHGLFLISFLPLFFLGWLVMARKNWRVALWLATWWIFALLPASVPENTPHALRSLNALLPLSIVIGVGLSQVALGSTRNKISRWLSLTLGFIIFFEVLRFAHFYFTVYPKTSSPEWQDGYKEIVQALASTNHQNTETWVYNIDDKWYLWLMAFGEHSGEEFQSWQSQGYQFTSIDTISFAAFNWDEFEANPRDIVVVSRTEELQSQLESRRIQPESRNYITTHNGENRFLMVTLGPDSVTAPKLNEEP